MSTSKKRKRSRWPLGRGRPTLGPQVCAWLEANLAHGPGDVAGRPYRLHPWAEDLVNRCYELAPDGTRRVDRALVGVAKGNAKTETGAAIACAEFAGPVTFTGWAADGAPKPGQPRVSPDIPVAAASFEQAGLLFGAARAMIQGGPLADYCDLWESEITLKGRPGRLYRVPAVAGANDGARPTFACYDELHEWAGHRERVYTVLEAGRAKRGGWSLVTTTAGFDSTSLLGRLYAHGQRVAADPAVDPGFLFLWREAAAHWDLSKSDQLEAAIREANPAVGRGGFLSLRNIVRQFHAMAPHDAQRYFLNHWVEAPTVWCPADLWQRQARPERVVAPGAAIVLGFDGSYNRDATALVGATLEDPPHLFTLGVWERPAQAGPDWIVPRAEVLAAITRAAAAYEVRLLGYDDTFGRMWSLDMAALAEQGVTISEWPTRAQPRMGPAAAAFLGALRDGRLTHDGHPQLAAHVAHCVTRGSRWGLLPVKETQDSTRRIDAAIAAVIAHDLAQRHQAEGTSGWAFLGFGVGRLDPGPRAAGDGFTPARR